MSHPTELSEGCVRLILANDDKRGQFYLDIPIDIACTLCLKPRKYLRYLGWCILGVAGTLVDAAGVEIPLEGELVDQSEAFPSGSRYTMQWIIAPEWEDLRRIRNNNDAAFKNQSLPKPSDILLHYNYGAAAVKRWGGNKAILSNRIGIPRPPAPVPAALGPTKVINDHTMAFEKRNKTNATPNEQAASEHSNPDDDVRADPEGQDGWDEDDLMLFFWGNSPAARERFALKQQQRDGFIQEWRAGVGEGPSGT